MQPAAGDLFSDRGFLDAFAAGLVSATAKCAALSNGQLLLSSPDVRRLSIEDVVASAGRPEVPVVGVYVGFSGGLSGHAVLLLPAADARRLAAMVLDGLTDPELSTLDPRDTELAELERSVIEEVANVAVSTVLCGLGDYLEETIHPSVPVFVFDMAGAILDGIVADAVRTDNTILTARTTFLRGGQEARGVLLVVPLPVAARGTTHVSDGAAAATAP